MCADHVRPGSWYLGRDGYVNATYLTTRLYGPGITDPPSLDLVESAIAVQRYWLDGTVPTLASFSRSSKEVFVSLHPKKV
jgi:hypothetical protein